MQAVAVAAGAVGMVGGQTIDLQACGQTPGPALALDGDGLRAMHARKTGALIRASAMAGAIMAGGSEMAVTAVEHWAAQIGLAFQIVDDILDVEGTAAELGKTAGKDAARAKPTYPALFGLERSRTIAAECAARAQEFLDRAGLSGTWLPAIAQWILERRA